MRARRVVVLDVGAEDSLEMAAVEDQEPVEALSTDGADEALGDGIRFGRSDRRAEDPDSLAAEDLVEGAGVLAVTVTDQETDPLLGEEESEVARLLGNPVALRVGGAASQVDAPAADRKSTRLNSSHVRISYA